MKMLTSQRILKRVNRSSPPRGGFGHLGEQILGGDLLCSQISRAVRSSNNRITVLIGIIQCMLLSHIFNGIEDETAHRRRARFLCRSFHLQRVDV